MASDSRYRCRGREPGGGPAEIRQIFQLRENSPIPQENDNHQQEWDDNEQHTLIHRVTAFLRAVLGGVRVAPGRHHRSGPPQGRRILAPWPGVMQEIR